MNVADNDGLTPLHHACYYAKFDLVKLLIAHGATIGSPVPILIPSESHGNQDNEKSTPLHHAVASSQPDIVDYLLKYGANVNAQVWRHFYDLLTTPLGYERWYPTTYSGTCHSRCSWKS